MDLFMFYKSFFLLHAPLIYGVVEDMQIENGTQTVQANVHGNKKTLHEITSLTITL